MVEFTFTLPVGDVNLLLKALEELPLKVSKGTYDRITAQAIAQQKAAETPAPPVPEKRPAKELAEEPVKE